MKDRVAELVTEFQDIFRDEEIAVGECSPDFFHEFQILLEPGAKPVKQAPSLRLDPPV